MQTYFDEFQSFSAKMNEISLKKPIVLTAVKFCFGLWKFRAKFRFGLRNFHLAKFRTFTVNEISFYTSSEISLVRIFARLKYNII